MLPTIPELSSLPSPVETFNGWVELGAGLSSEYPIWTTPPVYFTGFPNIADLGERISNLYPVLRQLGELYTIPWLDALNTALGIQ